jgi:mRNA interferase MazF
MTTCRPGGVVLVRFPFTHLQASKKRPALVISPPPFAQRNGDVLVIALTSKPQPEQYLYVEHWRHAGLLTPTWLKPVMFCLDETIIERQVGNLAANDSNRVTQALELLIAADYLPHASRPPGA